MVLAFTAGLNAHSKLVGSANAQGLTEVYPLYVVLKGFYEVLVGGPQRRRALTNLGINQNTLANAQRQTLVEIEEIPKLLSSSLRLAFENEDQKTLEALTNTYQRLSSTSTYDIDAINAAVSLANRNASRLGQYDVPHVLPAFLYASALQIGFLSLRKAKAVQFKAALEIQKTVLEKYIKPETQYSADIYYPARSKKTGLEIWDHNSHAPPTDSNFDILVPGDRILHIENKRIVQFGEEVIDALLMGDFGKDLQITIEKNGSEQELRIQRDVPVITKTDQFSTILEKEILEPSKRLIELRGIISQLQGKMFAVSQYVPKDSATGIEYGVIVDQFSADGKIGTSTYSVVGSPTDWPKKSRGWTYEFIARNTVRETGCTSIPHDDKGWTKTKSEVVAEQRVADAVPCIEGYLRKVVDQYSIANEEISELYRLHFLGKLAHERISNALEQINNIISAGQGDVPVNGICQTQDTKQSWLCQQD